MVQGDDFLCSFFLKLNQLDSRIEILALLPHLSIIDNNYYNGFPRQKKIIIIEYGCKIQTAKLIILSIYSIIYDKQQSLKIHYIFSVDYIPLILAMKLIVFVKILHNNWLIKKNSKAL